MLQGPMKMHESIIQRVEQELIVQELLFGDLTRGTNVIGLFQLFIDRSKRLIIFLVQPLQRFKEEFVFFYFVYNIFRWQFVNCHLLGM